MVNSVFHSSFSHPITMGKERIDIPVTPEVIEIEIGDRRMNSSEKVGITNNGVKILSRYLSASAGSCHNFCKYGWKHTFEANPKSPILKRITVTPGEGQYLEKTSTLAKGNKKSATSLQSSPDSKTQIANVPPVIKREVSSLAKKVGVSEKDASSTGNGIDVSARRASDSNLKPTKQCSLPTPGCSSIKRNSDTRMNPLGGSSIRRHSVIGIDKEMATCKIGEKVVLVPPVVSLSTPGCSSIKRNSDTRKNPLGGSSIRRHSVIGIGKEMGTFKMGEKEVLVPPVVSLSPRLSIKRVATRNNPLGGSSIRRQSVIGISKEVLVPPVVSLSPRLSVKRVARRKNPLGGSSIRRQSVIGIGKEMGTCKMGEKEVLVPSVVSLSPRPSVKRVASINAGNYKNLRGTSHATNRNIARKDKPEQGGDENVPEKVLYIIEPEAENKTAEPAQNGTHSTQLSPSSGDKSSRRAHNRIKTARSSPSYKNKNLSSARNGIHTTQSPPSSENKKLRHTRNRIRSTGSSSSPSPSSSLLSLSSSMSQSESSLSGINGIISEHNETGTGKQLASRKVEYMRRPRRSGITSSEDKDHQPKKLTFRRGKVVDLQSENNSPRRLRFRPRRLPGENQNVKNDAKMGRYRMREVVDGELKGNKTESKKVVLKHQDVEGKKDAQSLFNNVIEETASKLAVTRKSKVKALVCAFETVISLQETKPSSANSIY